MVDFKADERLNTLNHSCAHVMAQAVKHLYPEAKFWVGPVVKEGFYYDIDLGDNAVNDDVIAAIEKEMKKICKEGKKIYRREISKAEALELFKNDEYKLDLISDLEDGTISVYDQGDFTDLCRGPHVDKTKLCKNFKLVVSAELYGFPGRMDEIKRICEKHGALLIEDAAEAMGATIDGRQCGSFGDYSAVSYNGNKIITGSSGGCLLTNRLEDANRARKWSTQARENAAWYQHEEVGYNYRMSNVIAGVVRGQYPHLEEHIAQKKAIYERYKEGLKGLPVKMNPIVEGTEPNYWLSALIIDKDAMCKQVRNDSEALYIKEAGKTCPTEILEAIASINAEGRPIWKPMHMQPMYRMHECVGRDGSIRCRTNAYIAGGAEDVGADIFDRGACLPSDNKMTEEQQERIIRVIRSCFE